MVRWSDTPEEYWMNFLFLRWKFGKLNRDCHYVPLLCAQIMSNAACRWVMPGRTDLAARLRECLVTAAVLVPVLMSATSSQEGANASVDWHRVLKESTLLFILDSLFLFLMIKNVWHSELLSNDLRNDSRSEFLRNSSDDRRDRVTRFFG